MTKRLDQDWQVTLPRGARIKFPSGKVIADTMQECADVASACTNLLNRKQIILPHIIPVPRREKLLQLSRTHYDSPEKKVYRRIVSAGGEKNDLRLDELDSTLQQMVLQLYELLKNDVVPKKTTKLGKRVEDEREKTNAKFASSLQNANATLVQKVIGLLHPEGQIQLRRKEYDYLVEQGLVDIENERSLRIGDQSSLRHKLEELLQ